MSEVTGSQIAAEQDAAPPSDPAEVPVTTDAPDTSDATQEIAETDEQKNERELKEQKERSEKRARGIQKRLDELTADKYAERQRAERAEREREQLLALIQRGQQPQTSQAATDEPLRDQFNDYDTYIRAYAKWEARNEARSIVERELGAERQKVEQQSQRAFMEQQASQLAGHLAKSVDEFRKTTPDYDETVEALDFVPPPDMLRAILDTDNPAKVLHALGKNAAEARRIAGMGPIAIARAIGRIEATLTVPQVSKAPPPGKPVASKASSSNEPPQDTEAYMAWRKKLRG